METAEIGTGPLAGLLAVRDSTCQAGPALLFSAAAWHNFLATVQPADA